MTETRTVATAPTAPQPTPRITDHAMLVDLDMKRWTPSKKDKEVSREVSQKHGNDEAMGRFTKDLLAKDALRDLNSVYTAAGGYHRMHTTAWMDSGPRLLAAPKFDAYRDAMAAFEIQWDAAVSAFVGSYNQHVQNARRSLSGLFRDSDYPTAQEVACCYSFKWQVMPVPSSDHFEVLGVNAHIAMIRKQIEKQNQEALANTFSDVAVRVRKVVGHMVEKLTAYKVTAKEDGSTATEGIFRDTLTENVKELADLIPVLNVARDPELDRIAQEMQDLCVWTPQVLRESPQARQETAEKANAILSTLDSLI